MCNVMWQVELMHQQGADEGGITNQWVGTCMAELCEDSVGVLLQVWLERPSPSGGGIPSG